ncbi:MAG: alpha-ketoglutarate-dependent dioxygenase AlkB [Aestuariivita sp.]|nr:alpha-ketoglutarate-dependent dioxygenase AlkB [Aestuariivita sp.]
MKFEVRGFEIYEKYLDKAQQEQLLGDLRHVVSEAPFFRPHTPSGKPMTVRMTSAGRYGWYSDRLGYRYVRQHPKGWKWPNIPKSVLKVWVDLIDDERMPECCLVNYYDRDAKMGLHRDCDEADFVWPVLSISLGDDALFRMGNKQRGGSTDSYWLKSGDVVVMGGDARLRYHGIDRIRFGSSTVLKKGGRINLTMRVVD